MRTETESTKPVILRLVVLAGPVSRPRRKCLSTGASPSMLRAIYPSRRLARKRHRKITSYEGFSSSTHS